MLKVSDIGTTNDVGSGDPLETGDYQAEQDLTTLDGLAQALVRGSYRELLLKTNDRKLDELLLSLVYDAFERSYLDSQSASDAVRAMSLSPEADDVYSGSRLELRGGKVVAFNGYTGQQKVLGGQTEEELLGNFIRGAAYVLSGMVALLTK